MSKSAQVDIVFVLIVFCVFAVSALVSLVLGGNVYKNAIEQSQARYNERTSLFYIWTKIKNADAYDGVYVKNFDNAEALVLEENFFGERYLTYIYYHDGWVKELFVDASYEYDLTDGQAILSLDGGILKFEQLDDGIIRVSDSVDSLIITPRTGKAAGR